MKEDKKERRGAFYAPRKLTDEELRVRRLRRKSEEAKLNKELESEVEVSAPDTQYVPKYDRNTKLIAKLLSKIDFMLWSTPRLARMYLWRVQLFNAALVEGTGIMIYYAMLPLFNIMFGNIYIALTLTIPISFFCKFILYAGWMFKKPARAPKKENERKRMWPL